MLSSISVPIGVATGRLDDIGAPIFSEDRFCLSVREFAHFMSLFHESRSIRGLELLGSLGCSLHLVLARHYRTVHECLSDPCTVRDVEVLGRISGSQSSERAIRIRGNETSDDKTARQTYYETVSVAMLSLVRHTTSAVHHTALSETICNQSEL